MILFCNLVCVYVHKICEDKFGDCKKLFSWLGQKVNKRSMRMATVPITPHPGKTYQHLSLIEFEVTEYSYSIRISGYSI